MWIPWQWMYWNNAPHFKPWEQIAFATRHSPGTKQRRRRKAARRNS